MIGNQAGAGEGDAQTEDCRIDQQTGITETLPFVARRVVPADMVEPASPVRAAAVTFCRAIVKQRQVEQGLDGVHRPALREEARAAYRKHVIGHQLRDGVAGIYSAAEANREVDAGSAQIEEARVCDQLQL